MNITAANIAWAALVFFIGFVCITAPAILRNNSNEFQEHARPKRKGE